MDEEYLQMFFDEAEEYIRDLNDDILILEENPENTEVINAIFRAAHSLKGMAATMGFDELTDLTHKLENVLDLIREEKIYLDAEMIDALFEGIDLINELVEDIKRTGRETTEVEGFLVSLDEKIAAHNKGDTDDVFLGGNASLEGKEEWDLQLTEKNLKEIKSHGGEEDSVLEIRVMLKKETVLKSVRAYMILKKAEELGYLIKSLPDREGIENDEVEVRQEILLVLITGLNHEEIKEELGSIIDVNSVEINPLNIDYSRLETSITGEEQDSSDKNSSIDVSPTVRVDIEKLDNLMNMVGELLINKTQLEDLDIDNSSFQNTIQQLDRVTTELHYTVMQIRMVPISGIFSRFPRLVRDLCRDLDKEIDLNIEGEDTELDRSIIDELADPLVHLIRNAVDHGIEKPDKREEKGKSRTGIVEIRAYQKGSEIMIEIEDDGRGLDGEKIARKAVEKGLAAQEEIENMESEEKLQYIFEPGFSTSENTSQVSGRGVGMDVVKKVVESLDGQVNIESRIDEGTLISISLPLTLAITQALLVKIARETFAIPLDDISETLTVSPEEIKTIRGQEVIVPRDETIPITSAAHQLNIDVDNDRYMERGEIPVVTVSSGSSEIGLIIDEFLTQQEIVVKSMGEYLGSVENISGATIIGDGDVALILDVRKIA